MVMLVHQLSQEAAVLRNLADLGRILISRVSTEQNTQLRKVAGRSIGVTIKRNVNLTVNVQKHLIVSLLRLV